MTRSRLRLGVVTGYARGDTVYAGSEALSQADTYHLATDLFLASLMVGVDLPGGRGASIVMPMAQLRIDSDLSATRDTGLGDAEVRGRQDLTALWSGRPTWLPRLTLSLGAAGPSGSYVPQNVSFFSAPGQDRSLSIGRGAWWALVDAEMGGQVGERFGWFGGAMARKALSAPSDGYEWGTEVRSTAGVSAVLVAGRLSAATSVDLLWRGVGNERNVFHGERGEAPNSGGRWLDVTPTLQAVFGDGWSTTATVRIPLWREVAGVQSVQSYAVLLGVATTFGLGTPAPVARVVPARAAVGDRPDPDIARQLDPGAVHLVDYWATWCAPCVRLSAELETLRAQRPDLRVVKVDATAWSQPDMDRFLPGLAGLPALDIYGADGRLVARLEGVDAFDFARFLPPAPPVD